MGTVWQLWVRGITLAVWASGFGSAYAFDCVSKYCRDMSNCAEAHYKFTVCHEGRLDGDNDGIPCENVCGKSFDDYSKRFGESVHPPRPSGADQAQPLVQEGTDALERSLSGAFTCTGKHRCGDMLSCEEARFYLTQCAVRSLDRDHDGIPCESLCGGR